MESGSSNRGQRSSLRGRLRAVSLAAAPLVVLWATGCSENPTSAGGGDDNPWEDFDRNDFDQSSTNITNAWMGFEPGTRFTYDGTTTENNVPIAHRVEINVTHFTMVIDGVKSIVTYDLDYSDGELVEAELAFFAQDKFGNVWRMGEYPEEYEDGVWVDSPAWIQGFEEAVAGISMLANPQINARYSQGWGPEVGFTDFGIVEAMGLTRCGFPSKTDCHTDVLQITESAAGETGQQLKYFKAGVGNIEVGARGLGDANSEELFLTEKRQLDQAELNAMCAAVQALDEAGRLRSSAYAQTQDLQAPVFCP